MKNGILIGLVVTLAAAGGFYYYQSHDGNVIEENIVKPIVEKSIKNQTPEERLAMIEEKMQEAMMEAVESLEKLNPTTLTYGEEYAKSSFDQDFRLDIDNIPFDLMGMPNPGIERVSISSKSTSEIDASNWWHEQMYGKGDLVIEGVLTEEMGAQAGTTEPRIAADMEIIVDGDNSYIKLISIENNNTLIPLDTPPFQEAIDEIKGKWILFNEAMMDPFSSGNTDPNESNRMLMSELKETLEENAENFRLWKKPANGRKEGEWYIYDLELDKEGLTKSIKEVSMGIAKSVVESSYYGDDEQNAQTREMLTKEYLSNIEEFNLDNISSGNITFTIHETDLERWKANGVINNQQNEEIVINIDNTEANKVGSIMMSKPKTDETSVIDSTDQGISWIINDSSMSVNLVTEGMIISGTGTFQENLISVEISVNNSIVASLVMKKGEDTELWSGALSVPMFKKDGPMITWDISEDSFDAMLWMPGGEGIRFFGTYSETTFSAKLEQYMQNTTEETPAMITADFTKKNDNWEGRIDFGGFLTLNGKIQYEGVEKMMINADIAIMGQETGKLRYQMTGKPIKKTSFDIPKDSIPFTEIVEKLGVFMPNQGLMMNDGQYSNYLYGDYDYGNYDYENYEYDGNYGANDTGPSPAPGVDIPQQPMTDQEVNELLQQMNIPSLPTPDTSYYEELRTECNSVEGSQNCCLSSVDAMEAAGGIETSAMECPKGYTRNMMKCLESFAWCEPVQ